MIIPTHTGPITIPDDTRIITKNDLIVYCKGKEIDKTEYDYLTYNIPLGANLLEELNELGITSKYIVQLQREKKLERILKL